MFNLIIYLLLDWVVASFICRANDRNNEDRFATEKWCNEKNQDECSEHDWWCRFAWIDTPNCWLDEQYNGCPSAAQPHSCTSDSDCRGYRTCGDDGFCLGPHGCGNELPTFDCVVPELSDDDLQWFSFPDYPATPQCRGAQLLKADTEWFCFGHPLCPNEYSSTSCKCKQPEVPTMITDDGPKVGLCRNAGDAIYEDFCNGLDLMACTSEHEQQSLCQVEYEDPSCFLDEWNYYLGGVRECLSDDDCRGKRWCDNHRCTGESGCSRNYSCEISQDEETGCPNRCRGNRICGSDNQCHGKDYCLFAPRNTTYQFAQQNWCQFGNPGFPEQRLDQDGSSWFQQR